MAARWQRKLLFTAVCAVFISLSFSSKSFARSAKDVYGSDIYWNATPNEVNNLLKNLKDFADINYNMDVRFLGEIAADPAQNPVLFRSGHYNFTYTPQERKKLRAFLLGGGMIIYNTGLGSAPFYRSVIRELTAIFPEQPVQRLSSDHPIFHSYYDIDRVQYADGVRKAGFQGNEPWFDAIEINCRVVALVSRWGMSVGWQDSVEASHQAYMPDSAMKIGMNIFSYASAMRAWAKNAAYAMKFVDKDEASTDKISLVQVVYDGVWKTRHVGLSVLLQSFNQRTEVPVKFKVTEMRLADKAIFNAPIIYITGHEYFELPAHEIAQLRQYLENGGFLFAEACCGRKGFDMAFRRLMKQTLPRHQMQVIPQTSSIYQYPHVIKTLGVTPTLARDLGSSAVPPTLENITVDGHAAVIYSRFGLAGGWEMCQSPYALGYNDISCLKLGHNILMHAMTQ